MTRLPGESRSGRVVDPPMCACGARAGSPNAPTSHGSQAAVEWSRCRLPSIQECAGDRVGMPRRGVAVATDAHRHSSWRTSLVPCTTHRVWVLMLLCATPSWAQFETGSITGTVSDTQRRRAAGRHRHAAQPRHQRHPDHGHQRQRRLRVLHAARRPLRGQGGAVGLLDHGGAGRSRWPSATASAST